MTAKTIATLPLHSVKERGVSLQDLTAEWLELIEGCLENFAIIDLNGIIRYTNRGIPGLFSARASGSNFTDCVSSKHRVELECAMAKALQMEGNQEFHVTTVEHTPEMTCYSIKLFPMHREDAIVGFLLSSYDITMHRENEARLRIERDRAQQYLDIAGVILVAINDQGTVVLINRKGTDLLGYEESEILGRNWFDNFLPGSIGSSVKEVFGQLMSGENEPVEYYENPVLTRNGEERLIAWRNIILRDESGSITATLSSGEDITERKQAEAQLTHYQEHLEQLVTQRTAQLSDANEQLREAYRHRMQIEEQMQEHQAQLAHVCRLSTMAELATTIAHELNQPLSAVTNYARGIRRRVEDSATLSPEILNALDQIVAQAERAAKVIQRTRDYVTKRQVRRQDVNLMEVIAAAVELITPKAKRSSVRILTRCASELPVIRADQIQLEQVFVNLLSNAIEAIESTSQRSGEIKLCVEIKPGQMIEVCVEDNGPGMPSQVVDRLFDPFVTTKPEGMGMGLSITRSIVEAHGGQFWINTDVSSGVSFHFTLPISDDSLCTTEGIGGR